MVIQIVEDPLEIYGTESFVDMKEVEKDVYDDEDDTNIRRDMKDYWDNLDFLNYIEEVWKIKYKIIEK